MVQETDFNPTVHQREMLQAWTWFIETGRIQGECVPPHIAESWKRSRAFGVDPFDYPRSAYLDAATYEQRIADRQYLIHVSRPFMEQMLASLDAGRYLVILYDADGYHLLRMGRTVDYERISGFHIEGGICFEEEKMGTCGFSLAKGLQKPVQIAGCEHYASFLHRVVGSYAPIRDPIQGSLMGVLCIAGAMTTPSHHTLGTVVAASTAVENYIKLDHARRIFSLQGKSLQSMLDHLADGIFLIDAEGRIAEINDAARRIFRLSREVRGRPLAEVPTLADMAPLFGNALASREPEQETDLRIQDEIYVTSIRRIGATQDGGAGVLFQMRRFGDLSDAVRRRSADHTLISFDAKKPVQTVRRRDPDPVPVTFDSMIGASARMARSKHLGRQAARSEANIIIEGESGTGKEVFAHAVHNESRRAAAPFVIINCSAIPSELMESILFGHEQGAFTGARQTHIGKFELADGGTVFLDEIGEMSPPMQAKLLRVIEEKTIERIGGKRSRRIDVRIIAATNRNLSEEIRAGRFREDLFYRLNVFRMHLPPLRERKEDIESLAAHFARQFSALFNKTVDRISPGYLRALQAYAWPGNIRELRNAVEYSIAILDGPVLLEDHLLGFFPHPAPGAAPAADADPERTAAVGRLPEMEAKAIRDALASTGGNRTRAARMLGISRATLHRRLRTAGASQTSGMSHSETI